MSTLYQLPDSEEECRAQLDALRWDISDLRAKIATAKRRAAATGDYTDSEQFTKWEHALAWRGRYTQKVQERLGALLREKRAAANDSASFERRFIIAAKRRLTSEMYDELIREAKED